MIELSQKDGMTMLPLKVHAGAKRDGLAGDHDGRLRIMVRCAPEQGKANKQIIKILSDFFAVPKQTIHIVQGERNPLKTVAIALNLDLVRQKLEARKQPE